jgi:hypothetical protein
LIFLLVGLSLKNKKICGKIQPNLRYNLRLCEKFIFGIESVGWKNLAKFVFYAKKKGIDSQYKLTK